jgi:phosphatidylserine decarboxylase
MKDGSLASRLLFLAGVLSLVAVLTLLRLSVVTDHFYHALVKDPPRQAPPGRVVVAPADGTVLYVREVQEGIVPQVVKRGIPVPLADHLKGEPVFPAKAGYLIGIYMNTQGVHINRMPNHGIIVGRTIWNGPHMDMTRAERRIILMQLLPGLVGLRRLLGLSPHGIEGAADFVLKSARETLTIRDERGAHVCIVRIADYYVGKILTWVHDGQTLGRGEKIGMITWGSQTDLFIETTPGLEIKTAVGDYVYGGETIVATY